MKPDTVIALISKPFLPFLASDLSEDYTAFENDPKCSNFESYKTRAKLISLVRLIAIKVNQEINHFVKNKSAPFTEVLLAVSATNHFSSQDVY